eukprot:TRINITY_DN20426_c0_g1_i1.p1 TRINITY_DN20426_c0_g1~~TRINITY_DN20426_c0_g1_i1.p1  ORF type:complete len:196 (+),score=23.82 TRINITY_DN20426_c0_g1_i1:179-766(+)
MQPLEVEMGSCGSVAEKFRNGTCGLTPSSGSLRQGRDGGVQSFVDTVSKKQLDSNAADPGVQESGERARSGQPVQSVSASESRPRPIFVIYTFAIARDGSGNRRFDKPHHAWQVLYRSDINLTLDFVERMASIPMAGLPFVARSQLIVEGIRFGDTIVLYDRFSEHERPGALLQMPEEIRKKIGGNVVIEFKKAV